MQREIDIAAGSTVLEALEGSSNRLRPTFFPGTHDGTLRSILPISKEIVDAGVVGVYRSSGMVVFAFSTIVIDLNHYIVFTPKTDLDLTSNGRKIYALDPT